MNQLVPIGKTESIRSAGFDEYWLQDRIADNPNCLELGELELLYRERKQSSGGRLDMLLKNPEDDSMYEVEIMLGETDEKHIIHTIEYWDKEKRKWPQRQHFAVLVAESITRRFYNVIQLLSHAIPIIAIQVNIVEADGKKILHFSKVLDTYEEPEEVSESGRQYDEQFWQEQAPWTIEAARALLEANRTTLPGTSINCVKNYVAIVVNGNNYIWIHRRTAPRSLLGMWMNDEHFDEGTRLLDKAGLAYTKRKNQVVLPVDKGTTDGGMVLVQGISAGGQLLLRQPSPKLAGRSRKQQSRAAGARSRSGLLRVGRVQDGSWAGRHITRSRNHSV